MSARHSFAILAFVAASTIGIVGALAQKSIVVESHAGERPGDADELLGPVYAELQSRGYTGGSRLSDRMALAVSATGAGLEPAEADRARRFIDSAYEQYINGDFKLAIGDVDKGLDILLSRPAHMARDQKLRNDVYQRGLIIQALANIKLRRTAEATAAMAEFVRSFPQHDISRADWDPDANKLQRTVRADGAKQGLGKLEIKGSEPGLAIFVNERYVGADAVTLEELYPGKYRVYTQKSSTQPGRVHEVVLDAGGAETVNVNWELDGSLRTGAFTGFEFVTESERAEREGRAAVSAARKVGAGEVVVLGVRPLKGKRAIIGIVYDASTGAHVRDASVRVEPVTPSDELIRNLGRYLAGEEVEGLEPGLVGDKPGPVVGDDLPRDQVATADRPYRTWKWITGATGVAAMATGGVLIAIHKPEIIDGVRQSDHRNTRPAGIATLAAGGVITAVSIWMFIADAGDAALERQSQQLTFTPTEGGGVIGWSGRF